jgi:hypothetical protein
MAQNAWLCISLESAGIFIDMLEEKMPGEDAEKIRGINERRFNSFWRCGFDHIALQDAF